MLYFASCQALQTCRNLARWGVVPEGKIEWKSLRALDPQALSSIHQRYYPDLLRYAMYRIGDRMTAEDLVSETFIRLIDALKEGKGPSSNVRGWLLGTINNLVNDHYRATYRQDAIFATDAKPQVSDPLPQIDQSIDSHHVLSRALASLTDEQQMVISLRFGAGMSLDETAAAMERKANAIKALQFRAIAALRQQMEINSND